MNSQRRTFKVKTNSKRYFEKFKKQKEEKIKNSVILPKIESKIPTFSEPKFYFNVSLLHKFQPNKHPLDGVIVDFKKTHKLWNSLGIKKKNSVPHYEPKSLDKSVDEKHRSRNADLIKDLSKNHKKTVKSKSMTYLII